VKLAILSICFWVSLFMGWSAQAEPLAANATAQRDALLMQLTQVKLSKAAAVLDQLESISAGEILPLFNAMRSGELYYDRASFTLLAIRADGVGKLTAVDVMTNEYLGAIEKKSIKKIRVNNKLRVHLKKSITRINLNSVNVVHRRQAVSDILGDLNADNIALLETIKIHEQDAEVTELIELALAMRQLKHSSERTERLAAIEVLDGRLEPPVKNQLQQLVAADDADVLVKSAAQKALHNIEDKIGFYGFIEQFFFGLSLGSVLLLAAIGLAITFGVMGVINMAHGEMIMLGAYTTYVVQLLMANLIEYSLWVAIPAAFIVSGCVGIVIERCVIRHLHGRPLETLLATFGISLILQQAVRSIFSPLNRQVATPEWLSGSLEINAVLSITYNRLYILIFALLVFLALQLILRKTSLGLKVRAVSQNRNMAKAIGIRTDRVDAITFGLGSGVAGVAGVALSQLTNVGPNLGQAYIVDSFMVVVFGGVGNLLGTLFAGFSLGVANKFLEPVTGAVLANIFVLIFIILFIQKRPKGLFPQKGRAAE